MKNIWILTCANLRKSKGPALVFLLLSMLAAFLLNASLLSGSGFNKLFLQKALETNSADYTAILPRAYYESHQASLDQFFTGDSKVSAYESMDSIILIGADLQRKGGDKLHGSWNIRNADRTQNLSTFKVVEQLQTIPKDAIYVPYVCKTFFQYQLGDQLSFYSQGSTYTYHIAGFTEDVLFGSKSSMAFDLPQSAFDSLSKRVDSNSLATMLMAQTDQPAAKLGIDFSKKLGDVPFFTSSDKNTANLSRTSSLSIYNAIIMAFSVVNIIVCIIIINYRMKNTISQELRNIGALKAMGHTDIQIILSYVIQFGLLGLVGAIIGCTLVYVSIKSIISMIAVDVGFVWSIGFMPGITALCILLIAGCSVITAWLSAYFIRKIAPITALRGGVANHNFKTNHIPLDTSPLGLTSALAFKATVNNKKQSAWIISILAAVIMASAFAVILFFNMVLERDGLLQVTGAEPFSAISIASDLQDTEKIAEKIAEMPEVSKVIKAIGPGTTELLCDDKQYASLSVYDDYAALERPTIYEGRYPQHDNEAAISGNLSKILGKGIGDTIEVTKTLQTPLRSGSYLITGLTQGTMSGGIDIYLTMPGLQKIWQMAEWEAIHIYLHSGTNITAFLNTISLQFGDTLSYSADYEKLFNNQFTSNVNIVMLMVLAIMTMTAAIVLLVIFLVVHSILLERNQEFGIMKAIGYTTGQIVQQVAVSFLPVVLIGGIAGCILASFTMNLIVGLLFGSMGVHSVDFTIPIFPLIALVAAVCLLTYGMALLMASGARKISPCDMLNRSSE